MTSAAAAVASDAVFLGQASEMSRLIAAHDWSATLGPIGGWPANLRTTVGLMVHSPVPMVLLWGEDGVMIYNDAYSVFAGGRHPTLLGSKVREGWPEVADFNDNVMRVGLAGGTLAYRDQELTLNRSGSPERAWMNLDYSPVMSEDGRPDGVIAIVVETTAQVRSEAALRASEARLRFLDALGRATAKLSDADAVMAATTRLVGRHMGVAICAYADMDDDQDGFTIRGDWAQPGSVSIVGRYSLAAFGRRAVADLRAGRPLVIHDNLAELPPEEAATFQAIGVGATICMPLVKQGRLTALMAVHHAGPHAWTPEELALIREVTDRSWAHVERVAAEAELRAANTSLEHRVAERTAALEQSEQAMRTVLESSHQAQGLLNAAGEILYVNRTALDIVGVRLEDVVGRPYWNTPWFTGTPGAPEMLREAIARVAEGRMVTAELALDTPGGRRCWDFSLRPVFDEAGAVSTMVPEAIETTARLQAESALRQSQKMEAIGQLTGGLAHDFNNLLAGVSGSFEMLARRLAENRTADADRYIQAGLGAAHRAAALTQRLLAFSRQQTLDPRAIDLNRLIDGMGDLIRSSAGPLVAVEVRAADDLWPVRVDVSQLENSLLNLCINARDAMAPKGGRLTIETGNVMFDAADGEAFGLPPGPFARLTVSDTGVGMSPEVIARAFDPFFTTKPLGEGTGLGLSMIYGFVRQSGGEVRVESELGAGAAIHIYLPRHFGQAQAEAPSAPADPDPGLGETVLVIDDEQVVRMLIADVLEEAGYRVLQAADGAAGLSILQSDRRIDLLVSDVGLPGGMNGRQVADAARVTKPGLKVLFVTGYAETAVVGDGVMADGMEVITKPFPTAGLAAKVRELLDR
ncbi:hypothetical protein AS593_19625 [Caulobacter vibrioides]|nr:hypothetical protein AS593_19625 [Caulobacter vibrioides]